MFCNPRYGVVGLVGFPYFVLFETIGPVVEFAGYVLTVVGLLSGLISGAMACLFLIVSVVFGFLGTLVEASGIALSYEGLDGVLRWSWLTCDPQPTGWSRRTRHRPRWCDVGRVDRDREQAGHSGGPIAGAADPCG